MRQANIWPCSCCPPQHLLSPTFAHPIPPQVTFLETLNCSQCQILGQLPSCISLSLLFSRLWNCLPVSIVSFSSLQSFKCAAITTSSAHPYTSTISTHIESFPFCSSLGQCYSCLCYSSFPPCVCPFLHTIWQLMNLLPFVVQLLHEPLESRPLSIRARMRKHKT